MYMYVYGRIGMHHRHGSTKTCSVVTVVRAAHPCPGANWLWTHLRDAPHLTPQTTVVLQIAEPHVLFMPIKLDYA